MQNTSQKLTGFEILSFEGVELSITEANKTSIVSTGNLSVTYFKEFGCFILYLNNWDYALNKNLPIISSSRTDALSRSYLLPTYGGYYTLKVNKINHIEAIQNFETILNFNSRFGYLGETESLEQFQFPGGAVDSKNIMLTKSAGPGAIKKGLSMLSSTFSRAFKRQKEHINATQVRDIENLKATEENLVESFEFEKEDVSYFDLIKLINFRWKDLLREAEILQKE